ncbi:MAG: glycosyltransferase family 39 protein [Planctomycetota bacterium]|nr:glycosyltransferase family 39 protein [Planctomycetota bacterium]
MESQRAIDLEMKGNWRWDILLLLAVCVVVLWIGLGATRLWDQDEGYYASVAREMYERQDWVVPTFNQKLFAHKPPLMYWGMICGFHLFGVSEFSARWVSAIFGTGMVLMTYWMGRLLIDRQTALMSALVLACSLMFTVVARSATADVHLGFFVLVALTLWVRDAKQSLNRISTGGHWASDYPVTHGWTWLSIYVAIAFAVLSKGPIGFAFPIAILGTLTLLWPWVKGQRVALWSLLTPKRFLGATVSMQPWVGAVALIAIAAPWFWIVHERTDGAFFGEFFGVQHLERFSKPMDNHSGPIYYYLISILVGFFPWTSFAIPIGLYALGARSSGRSRFAWTVLGVWLFFYLGVFSLASTKLPNYIIPAYPAVALWIGSYFSGWLDRTTSSDSHRSRFWPMAGWTFMVVTGAVLSALPLILASWFVEPWLENLEVDPKMLPAIATFAWLGVLLLCGGFVGWLLERQCKPVWSLSILAGVCVAWVVLIWQLILPRIDRFQTPQQIAIEHLAPSGSNGSTPKRGSAQGDPVVVGMFRPSMVFYSEQTLNFCPDDPCLQKALSVELPPRWVVVHQASPEAQRLLDSHGYGIADTLESFPKKGLIEVYRK